MKSLLYFCKSKIIMLILVILCVTLFISFYYKSIKNGNNIIKQDEKKFIDNILNSLEQYEAKVELIVISNKNVNNYIINQKVTKDYVLQEVVYPVKVKYEYIDGKIVISNTELNIRKIVDNYKSILTNSLFLNTFVKEYQENESTYEINDKQIILKVKSNFNTYLSKKEVYVNKNDLKVQKMIIKSDNENDVISIKYNDINYIK